MYTKDEYKAALRKSTIPFNLLSHSMGSRKAFGGYSQHDNITSYETGPLFTGTKHMEQAPPWLRGTRSSFQDMCSASNIRMKNFNYEFSLNSDAGRVLSDTIVTTSKFVEKSIIENDKDHYLEALKVYLGNVEPLLILTKNTDGVCSFLYTNKRGLLTTTLKSTKGLYLSANESMYGSGGIIQNVDHGFDVRTTKIHSFSSIHKPLVHTVDRENFTFEGSYDYYALQKNNASTIPMSDTLQFLVGHVLGNAAAIDRPYEYNKYNTFIVYKEVMATKEGFFQCEVEKMGEIPLGIAVRSEVISYPFASSTMEHYKMALGKIFYNLPIYSDMFNNMIKTLSLPAMMLRFLLTSKYASSKLHSLVGDNSYGAYPVETFPEHRGYPAPAFMEALFEIWEEDLIDTQYHDNTR